MLTEQQKIILKKYLQGFLDNEGIINAGQKESYLDFWEKRVLGAKEIKETVGNYINGSISLQDFKETSEKQCRKFPYWGFKSFSGQMQLNQYVNNIKDSKKDSIFKKLIQFPKNMEEAKEKINEMRNYLSFLKRESENPKLIPRTNQIFLLSYFWEIQNIGQYPVYFGSSKKVLVDLGLIQDSYDSPGEEYLAFVDVMGKIRSFFGEETDVGEKPLWFVEHVIWDSYIGDDSLSKETEKKVVNEKKKGLKSDQFEKLGSAWIPPILFDLEDLAFNKETKWSKERKIKPEKAFETKLKYVFTILGYESEELGQGKGREPDGIAISHGVEDGEYAIVYDAKAREKYYAVGTGDREISEYIKNKKSELKTRRVNRIYFLIVSSNFSDNPNDINLIREVYRRTQVPITLIKANDLLFILENKLKNSDLNHAHLEDLFLDTGIKTRSQIVDLLSNKIEL